jgi:hypothetical protein
MRILLLHHFPVGASEAGHWVERWGTALVVQGHDVRALVVDDGPPTNWPFAVERVICRAGDAQADLTFELPTFSAPASTQLSFTRLNDRQLGLYRERLRKRLDQQIEHFDPQVIHAQHIWIQGQLALESGVPYLLNAWGPEMAEARRDARLGELANQAAENAGRILVADPALVDEVKNAFEALAERVLPLGAELQASGPFDAAAGCRQLIELYEAVLVERFGRVP